MPKQKTDRPKYRTVGDRLNKLPGPAQVHHQRRGTKQRCVLESLEKFLLKRLRLPINKEKSGVVRSGCHTFLGYSFYGVKNPRLRIAPKSYQRLKDKIRGNLRRWRGMELKEVITELNNMIRGWIVYYRLADGREHLLRLEAWLMHHLRCIMWRQWKTSRTRFQRLISFGVNRDKSARAAWGRGGPWYSSATSAMNMALSGAFFEAMGWLGILKLYDKYKINIQFV